MSFEKNEPAYPKISNVGITMSFKNAEHKNGFSLFNI